MPSSMPKWLIPVIVAAWGGGAVAAYYGYWIPVVVLLGLGILAATSAAGILWAQRGAVRMANKTLEAKAAAEPPRETPAEATARRREEARRRHERNRKRRRKG